MVARAPALVADIAKVANSVDTCPGDFGEDIVEARIRPDLGLQLSGCADFLKPPPMQDTDAIA